MLMFHLTQVGNTTSGVPASDTLCYECDLLAEHRAGLFAPVGLAAGSVGGVCACRAFLFALVISSDSQDIADVAIAAEHLLVVLGSTEMEVRRSSTDLLNDDLRTGSLRRTNSDARPLAYNN